MSKTTDATVAELHRRAMHVVVAFTMILVLPILVALATTDKRTCQSGTVFQSDIFPGDPMTVREMIERLSAVADKDLPVYTSVCYEGYLEPADTVAILPSDGLPICGERPSHVVVLELGWVPNDMRKELPECSN